MHGPEILWGKDTFRRPASENQWGEPHRWIRMAARQGIRFRVFCGSMCDVMERRADLNPLRRRLYRLIEETPDLDWLLLTKRPQEFRKLLPKNWQEAPRHNVWLMTTVEQADYLSRIDAMLETPAVVHGISVEPILSAMDLPRQFLRLGARAWVIAGGESGPGARPPRIEWIRHLRDQCVCAGVPFHFKQWGAYSSTLVRIGKKKAGRVLDGREWDQLPNGSACEKCN
jgi:protein gp37